MAECPVRLVDSRLQLARTGSLETTVDRDKQLQKLERVRDDVRSRSSTLKPFVSSVSPPLLFRFTATIQLVAADIREGSAV